MPNNKIYFIGILVNADSSTLKIALGNGFQIKSVPFPTYSTYDPVKEKRVYPYKSHIEEVIYNRIPPLDRAKFLSKDKNYYFSYKILETNYDYDRKEEDIEDEELNRCAFAPYDFQNECDMYISDKLKSARLYKEGNIGMPFSYSYIVKNGKPCALGIIGFNSYFLFGSSYILKDQAEIDDFNKFLDETKLPSTGYLQLAFENFEFSYSTYNPAIAFLSLMVALETMFNPGQIELKYRISRNAAVLLGNDKKDADRIFKEMKALYDKRSILTHTGNSKNISEEDVLIARDYVRRSIKKLISVNKSRDEVLSILNMSGFGELPFG